jgi:integral membrane protein (TIGR01906 family)
MKRIYSIFSVLISIIIPVFLLMTAIRLLITPEYPKIEYNMPGFPADPYGFTKQDRLYWSQFAIDYLTNSAGINYLSDLHFPDGSPLYNERELSHMVDVKNLVQAMIKAWWILLAALIGLGIWAWRSSWLSYFWYGVSRGGWATIGMIVAILVATAISFEGLFTEFHRIFFTGSSWIFLWSDTLIRLFPLPFWRDGFIFMGAVTILSALLCIYLGRKFAWQTASKGK